MNADRERLSVVVLTKNEAPRIGRCLASVAWADERLVVDGMSTDGTAALAERSGARVILHPFEGSFAQERNLGQQHATGDWVLHLDADDVATPGFRRAVEAVLARRAPEAAFKFRRKSILLGRFMRHGGWHHYLPNLVRRERVRYDGLVHERPVVGGAVGILDADVEHYPCEDLAIYTARHNRYTSLHAQELRQQLGDLPTTEIHRRLLRRPRKSFWKTYVKKAGWREGTHGLVFAWFFAGVELLKWAKYWELCHAGPSEESLSAFLDRRNRETTRAAERADPRALPQQFPWQVARLFTSLQRVPGAGADPLRGVILARLSAFADGLADAKAWQRSLRLPAAHPLPAPLPSLEPVTLATGASSRS
jgi:(heptosyl)LPS beta-1,4-glucosyltransferase